MTAENHSAHPPQESEESSRMNQQMELLKKTHEIEANLHEQLVALRTIYSKLGGAEQWRYALRDIDRIEELIRNLGR